MIAAKIMSLSVLGALAHLQQCCTACNVALSEILLRCTALKTQRDNQGAPKWLTWSGEGIIPIKGWDGKKWKGKRNGK